MDNVVVLMSCFNGELYVKEQIDTILSQKDLMALCIRDDGSSDNTIPIVKQIIESHREIDIRIIEGRNLGVAQSFLQLMRYAETNYPSAEYFAFADQDDYWLQDKVEIAVSHLCKTQRDSPALYISQYQMADEMLNLIATPKLRANIWLEAAMVNNIATGCTMVMNRCLVMIINSYLPQKITMHDYWVYLVALSINADVYYDSESHFLYRQHARNVIGGLGSSFLDKWTARWFKLFRKGKHYHSNMATELIKGYSQLMPKKNLSFLNMVSCQEKIFCKLKLLFNYRMRGSSFDKTIRCKFLILTGKY